MLPTIWFFIIALEVALYVALDGADLGIGVLSLFSKKEETRSLMIHILGPIWDANETWLVIAGGTLFGAFPLVYGIVLSALYLPVMLLLFGLITRAASFEFYGHSVHKKLWGRIFGFGSLLTIIAQGCAVGGFLGGITILDGHFAGGTFDWATPLTLFTTIGILFSYVVVGYAYLAKKSDFALKQKSFIGILFGALLSGAAFLGATLLLPQVHAHFLERWTTEPTRSILFMISAGIGVLSCIFLYNVLRWRNTHHIHTLTILIFLFALSGVLVALFPYIIPPSITVNEAAASPTTLRFMLFGIAPLLPIIISYNWFVYHVFRGRHYNEITW